jgi:hypothetical protein
MLKGFSSLSSTVLSELCRVVLAKVEPVFKLKC